MMPNDRATMIGVGGGNSAIKGAVADNKKPANEHIPLPVDLLSVGNTRGLLNNSNTMTPANALAPDLAMKAATGTVIEFSSSVLQS